MQEDILTRIKTSYNQLGAAEMKVANLVTADPGKVIFMSISELAEACGVSDSTVFRFCQKLGAGGYQEFKMLLSLGLGKEEPRAEKADSEAAPLGFSERAARVLETNIAALRETCSLLREEDVNRAVEAMHGAGRIAFFGAGASLLSAMKAMNKFMRITDKAVCVQDLHLQAMQASLLRPGDAAVVFSYSGSSRDTVSAARIAKGAGACVICISRFRKSPLAEFADILLLSGANEGPLQGGSTSAGMGQLFLADILYEEYYRRYYGESRANNEKTSAAVADRLY